MSNRMLIWSGVSQLDNTTPLIVLATGLGKSSQNRKTGDMVQTWILRADMSPVEALVTGQDRAICGTCPHRGKASGGSGACYVNVGQGPRSTFVSHQRVSSLPLDLELLRGRRV